MAYTVTNYRNKKELKEAVASGTAVRCYNPGPFPIKPGTVYLEGPHYPEAHKWYASARLDDALCIIPGSIK